MKRQRENKRCQKKKYEEADQRRYMKRQIEREREYKILKLSIKIIILFSYSWHVAATSKC